MMAKKKSLSFTEVQTMIQWVTFAFAVLSFAYNGYKQSQFSVPNAQGLIQNATVVQNAPVYNPMPVMYWQVAFDPNTGRFYHLHSDGKWYDQPPQIQVQQVQNTQTVNPWVR